MDLKQTERVELAHVAGVAEYIPSHAPGSKLLTGWMLRLEIGDFAIEGWGPTQDEAHHMFKEVLGQWLKDTNRRPVIK